MNQITKEVLIFLEEAREAFQDNTKLTTYRDVNEEFIALRTGMFDDCIKIFELGDPVGNFVQQLPRQHKVLVDYDELTRLQDNEKKLRGLDILFSEYMNEEIVSAEFIKRVVSVLQETK